MKYIRAHAENASVSNNDAFRAEFELWPIKIDTFMLDYWLERGSDECQQSKSFLLYLQAYVERHCLCRAV